MSHAFFVIASSVPALGPILMDETNTAVIARLDVWTGRPSIPEVLR
jgi:hypothetical protein